MLLRAALLALAIGVSGFTVAPTAGADAVPDEPGAVVLPEAAILQAVVADLDGDGSREVVRLVRGNEDSALAEVWSLRADGWALVDEPVEVLPEARNGPRVNPVYAGVPLRLLVHRVDGVDGVVVATQPRFNEIDSGPPCCLVLHSLVVENGALRRVAVAPPTDPVDGILSIDLDGDGTDELLTALSLHPLGDISFPTEARVYRWRDGSFGPPTVTELPIGSGDTPFNIGDSDGRRGDEAVIVSTLGAPGLYRIALGTDDSLVVDDFVADATQAMGVPMGDGRGIAVVSGDVVSVHRWPAFGPPGPAEAVARLDGPQLVGVIRVGDESRLLVHQRPILTLRSLTLPNLTRPQGGTFTYTRAARAGSNFSIPPYVGPLPGGAVDGSDAVIFAGQILPSPDVAAPTPLRGALPSAAFLGSEPVGLAADRGWMAILHSPYGSPSVLPTGGRFDAPAPQSGAWVSLAPLETVLSSELDGGVLAPPIDGAVPVGGGSLAMGLDGMTVNLAAPPGSRVFASDMDAPGLEASALVQADGRRAIFVVPQGLLVANASYRAARIVLTPAGHAYVARWNLQVLTEPPKVRASTTTPFGSSEVLVAGRTSPDASVRVDGLSAPVSRLGEFAIRVSLPPWPTDVEVIATDVVGNTSRIVVSGIGVVDYRTLPWIPIVAFLVAVAGGVLYLRVPRRAAAPLPVDDDAVLEELEPD